MSLFNFQKLIQKVAKAIEVIFFRTVTGTYIRWFFFIKSNIRMKVEIL